MKYRDALYVQAVLHRCTGHQFEGVIAYLHESHYDTGMRTSALRAYSNDVKAMPGSLCCEEPQPVVMNHDSL